MREMIFDDDIVTIEVGEWGGVVYLYRTSKVPRETFMVRFDAEDKAVAMLHKRLARVNFSYTLVSAENTETGEEWGEAELLQRLPSIVHGLR